MKLSLLLLASIQQVANAGVRKNIRMRKIVTKYDDPLDLIWIHAAKCCGIYVERDTEVYAAWDGINTLRIGASETLDPDDSLAQMIFHEICHALVEGPEALQLADWGLEFENPDHEIHEFACLRVQAALADEFGLRGFLASTTDYRLYFDRLPEDPLAEDQSAPEIKLAQEAMKRAKSGPWAEPIAEALRRTRAIADIVSPIAQEGSHWKTV